MAENDGKSKVEELKETLYSRTSYEAPKGERSPVDPAETASVVEDKWNSPELDEMLTHERRQPEGHPTMKKIFIFAALFFVGAVVVAAYMFLGGGSFVSSKNVDISIVGPANAAAGEVFEMGIVVSNRNNADLQVANLSIQYPQGSRDPDDPSKSLSYVREELGEIKAGDEVNRTGRIILFGEQGDIQEIKVSVEYTVRGSNATFSKDKMFEVVIGNTPVSMTIEQPRFINSGDKFTTTLTLTQNSEETIQNVMVRGEYPYGYTVLGSEPTFIADGNLWSLGDMAPGAKKTLTIEGQLRGENEEERTFRFYVGVADPRSRDPRFGSNLVSAFETITISRPSVALNLELNGNTSSTYVAPAGRSVSARVRYQNNLSEKLMNPRLEVRLSGSALDERTVEVRGGGFYDSQSNTISWDIENGAEDKELLPGDSGYVSFSFASLPSTTGAGEIQLDAKLAGTPLGGETITVAQEKAVRISSQVTLSSKALYSTGPFANHGSLPPKAEQETTYTVVLTAGNTQNNIENAKVTAELGPNVRWVSGGEGVTYNEASNSVSWSIGTLESGAGFSSPTREASFQVSLTPSLSQVGTAPTLVSGITLVGRDTFTTQAVTVTNSPISTRLTSDPVFVQGDDLVTR